MEIVQDYCNYIQITQGELESLVKEIDDFMSQITTEDEKGFQGCGNLKKPSKIIWTATDGDME